MNVKGFSQLYETYNLNTCDFCEFNTLFKGEISIEKSKLEIQMR